MFAHRLTAVRKGLVDGRLCGCGKVRKVAYGHIQVGADTEGLETVDVVVGLEERVGVDLVVDLEERVDVEADWSRVRTGALSLSCIV